MEKEDILLQIWKDSPSEISEQTWDNLTKIQQRIALSEKATLQKNWVGQVAKYAAVAAIWVVTVLVLTK